MQLLVYSLLFFECQEFGNEGCHSDRESAYVCMGERMGWCMCEVGVMVCVCKCGGMGFNGMCEREEG